MYFSPSRKNTFTVAFPKKPSNYIKMTILIKKKILFHANAVENNFDNLRLFIEIKSSFK